MNRLKIVSIAGARPNFVNIAPLMAAFRAAPEIEPLLIHTGQHYDELGVRRLIPRENTERPITVELLYEPFAQQFSHIQEIGYVASTWKDD